MKRVIVFLLFIIVIPTCIFAQSIMNVDYISPFHEGLAAIKKDNQWGFINTRGDIVVDFRDDLVTSFIDGYKYPFFNNDRCLINEKRDGILYFGYINKTGEIVVRPEFLNATNFVNNFAIALKLTVENIGKNPILNKNIVYYKYFEVIIDTDGFIKEYLSDPINIVLDKEFLSSPPPVKSKFISDNLVATMDNNSKTWSIKNINNLSIH